MKQMKMILLPLSALFLFAQCTSIHLYLMKDRVPGIDLLKFEAADLEHRRSAVYKSADTTISLEAQQKDDGTAVLLARDSADDSEIMVNGERMKKNELSYEYHFDDKGAAAEVFLVTKNKALYKIVQALIPVHETQLVAEKAGFSILTHAGKFDCTMRVEKEKDSYYVYFLNASILGRVARCHILDEAAYARFTALEKKRQETYLSKGMLEIYSAK